MDVRRCARTALGSFSTALVTAAGVLVCGAAEARVYDAGVSWRPVAGAAGYKVYVGYGADRLGRSRNVGRPVAVDGRVTIVMTDLPLGPTGHFSVTSYAPDGSESLLSNRLSLSYAKVAAVLDSDGDGLTDAQEDVNLNGVRDGAETDPENWDSDGDGTGDGDELTGGHDPNDVGSAPVCGGVCAASVWLDATGAAAELNGDMRSDTRYAAGADRDIATDALTITQVFADDTRNAMSGGSGDDVRYRVYLPVSGRWYLWARMYYPGAPNSNDANSFLVSVDGGSRRKLGNNKDRFRRWHWDGRGDIEWGSVAPLDLGRLSAGHHTLAVEKREVVPAPPRLDVLVLTPDPGYVPNDRHARAALAAGVMHAAAPDLAAFTMAAQGDPGAASTTTTSSTSTTTSTLPACTADADCDDGAHCTLDRCDAVTGACSHVPFDAFCDDGDACNGAETCDPVDDCRAGVPLSCDDALVCNGVETCEAALGCVPGAPPLCDDGVACTVDRCVESAGGCLAFADDVACADGNACTDERCTAQGCASAASEGACDDGLACTVDDTCAAGRCAGRNACAPGYTCDADANACTPVPRDPDRDGLRGDRDPCPLEARNLCAGPVAVDARTSTAVRVNAHAGDAACAGAKVDCHGELWAADFGFDAAGRTEACDDDGDAAGSSACEVAGVDRMFGCSSEATLDVMRCSHGASRDGGAVTYRFDVGDGRYVVNLYFAVRSTADVDVSIEGGRAGGRLGLTDDELGRVAVRSFVVEVSDADGLTIELRADDARATVAALEVLHWNADPAAP